MGNKSVLVDESAGFRTGCVKAELLIMGFAKTEKGYVLLLLALALSVRLAFLVGWGMDNKIYDSLLDQYTYLDLAENLTSGKGLSVSEPSWTASPGHPTSHRVPLYPMLLAISFLLFGKNFLVVRVFQAILGALTCVCVYFIGKKSLGTRIGRVAGLITALYFPLIMYIRPLMTETVYTFLLALSILWLYALFQSPAVSRAMILGGIMGLTFLTRPEFLGFALIIPPMVLCVFRNDLRQGTQLALISLLGLVLIISPWVARNWLVHGELVVLTTGGGLGLWEANYLRYQRQMSDTGQEKWASHLSPERQAIADWENLSEIERDSELRRQALEFIKDHPQVYAWYALTRVHMSYPIIPREELPPPIGWKGQFIPGGYLDFSPTSLDDFPAYVTTPEKLRVWSFRLAFALAGLGVLWVLHRRRWRALPLLLVIAYNVATAGAFEAKERYRLPFDPYLIILASYGLIFLAERLIRRGIISKRVGDA